MHSVWDSTNAILATLHYAMAGSSLDVSKQRFKQDLVKYVVNTVGLRSVGDFVNLVTQAGYETELDKVLGCGAPRDKPNSYPSSRIRAAWRAARAQITELKKSQRVPTENLKKTVYLVTQDSLLQQWRKRCSLELPVHLQPLDSVLGRLYRAQVRNTPTLIPIAEGKS